MAERHLHFVQSLEPLQGGGLGVAALQLHGAMQATGRESKLISTRQEGFSVQWPGVEQYVRRGPDKAFFAPALGGALPSNPLPMFVHGHGLYVYPNYCIGGWARRKGLPLVYHAHGFFEPWILNRSRLKKRIASWLFEDANLKAVQLWRALTAKEADQIRTVRGANANVVVAPNGIDLAPFGAPKPAGEKRKAVFLGRLHPKKGLDLLVRAWCALGAATAGWELVIAGPDEGNYRAAVEDLVRSAPGAQISFIGPVMGAKKFELLASAQLFVLFSYSEGFPMALLEAMAAGVPIAATHECNLPEVAQVEAGWLCHAKEDEVRTTLQLALTAPTDELRQRGANGRRLVERKFTWAQTVDTLSAACAAL